MPSHLLWIDDECGALPEQVRDLEAASIAVDCAATVQEGLARLRNGNYQGILLDMILPWQSEPDVNPRQEILQRPFLGTEVVQEVEKLPADKRPRIVVLTIAQDDRLLRKLVRWKKMGVIRSIIAKTPPLSFGDVTRACAEAIGAGN
jgi:ActR/RegA family two-component response regulator